MAVLTRKEAVRILECGDTPYEPRSVYAQTKLEGDRVVEQSAGHAFSWTIVRPAAVIGPNIAPRPAVPCRWTENSARMMSEAKP